MQTTKYEPKSVEAVVIRDFENAMKDSETMVRRLIQELPVRIRGLHTDIGDFKAAAPEGEPNARITRPCVTYREQTIDGVPKWVSKAIEHWHYDRVLPGPVGRVTTAEENEKNFRNWAMAAGIDVLFFEPDPLNDERVQDAWYVRYLRPVEMRGPEGFKGQSPHAADDPIYLSVTYTGEVFRGPLLCQEACKLRRWLKYEQARANQPDYLDELANLYGTFTNANLPAGLYLQRG